MTHTAEPRSFSGAQGESRSQRVGSQRCGEAGCGQRISPRRRQLQTGGGEGSRECRTTTSQRPTSFTTFGFLYGIGSAGEVVKGVTEEARGEGEAARFAEVEEAAFSADISNRKAAGATQSLNRSTAIPATIPNLVRETGYIDVAEAAVLRSSRLGPTRVHDCQRTTRDEWDSRGDGSVVCQNIVVRE